MLKPPMPEAEVTLEQYLQFWAEKGQTAFVLQLEDPSGRFTIAPLISVNAGSMYGVFTFEVKDNRPIRVGEYS